MPLFDLSSEQAIANRRANPNRTWGDRSAPNRIEPIAKPAFDVPFRLQAGDSIFTIGSCFARNVEQALAERGFHIPMREVFKRPEFAKTDRAIVNNYATPCIYNELAWAFGEEYYDNSRLIAEVAPGRFVDLNFTPSLRPESREVVDNRRRAISEAYRSSAHCRVVIITLGLSEVWFDCATHTYLNVSPRPTTLRSEPERFRLHVLSFEDTCGFLDKALTVLRKHSRDDQRVILTVSPVPLSATHRSQDVIVANTYSKSVLRVASETISAHYSHVAYFPSYESFVLSDRKLAFVEDLIHTQPALVNLNVNRMVDAYTGSEETLEAMREAIAQGGEMAAVEKARSVSLKLADDFFAAHGHWSHTSVEFAKAHARQLLKQGNHSKAMMVAQNHAGADDLELVTLLIEIAVADGQPDIALRQAELLPPGRVKAVHVWDQLLSAAIKKGEPEFIMAVLTRLIANVKVRTPTACWRVGRFFRDTGNLQKAVQLFQAAYEAADSTKIALEYAEALLSVGRSADARSVLERVVPSSPAENQKLVQLRLIA